MLYTTEVFDRKTGELIDTDAGEWMTITELAQRLGVGPRHCREVLRELDVIAMAGGAGIQRHHFTPWFLNRGFGRRHPPTKARQYPFDVVGPAGREWIEQNWEDAFERVETRSSSPDLSTARVHLRDFQVSRRRENMPTEEMVYWIFDHYPRLSHNDISTVVGVSQQMVSRLAAKRKAERARWRKAKSRWSPQDVKPVLRGPRATTLSVGSIRMRDEDDLR